MERLQDRVAVITGAASGIGYATAQRFAAEGAKVVIVDLNEEVGTKVAEELGGIYVKANVTSEEDVQRMYKVAFDTYGRIDIAFNNAGISPPDDDSILTTGIDAWRRVQEVNLTSVYLCCKYVLPYMQKAGKGSIINTASFAKDPERAARRLIHIPFGRFAEPTEIAAAVAFLASDDSSFITASNFLVDGGISGAYVTPLSE